MWIQENIKNFKTVFPLKINMLQRITYYALYELIIYVHYLCHFYFQTYDILMIFIDFYVSYHMTLTNF